MKWLFNLSTFIEVNVLLQYNTIFYSYMFVYTYKYTKVTYTILLYLYGSVNIVYKIVKYILLDLVRFYDVKSIYILI